MTLEELRLLIPPYLSRQLDPAEQALFEQALETNSQLRSEVEEFRSLWEGLGLLPEENPSPAVRARFYQTLNAQLRGRPASSRSSWFSWWRPAFAQPLAIALATFLLGAFVGRMNFSAPASSTEMTQMRAQLQDLRQTVALSLLDRQSASSRLQGVSWSHRVDRPDQPLLTALLAALNHDQNINVRLSALDALEKFSGDPTLRKALVDSIPMQDSPLVQIALIDALVHIRDNAALTELRKITGDAQINAAVRERAQWGVTKLTYQ